MIVSPATTVIYSIKFPVFRILGGDFLEPKSGYCREYTACIRDWCKNQGLFMHCEFEIITHYYQSNVFRHEIRQAKPSSKLFPSV